MMAWADVEDIPRNSVSIPAIEAADSVAVSASGESPLADMLDCSDIQLLCIRVAICSNGMGLLTAYPTN